MRETQLADLLLRSAGPGGLRCPNRHSWPSESRWILRPVVTPPPSPPDGSACAGPRSSLRRNPRRQLPRVLASTDPATRPTPPTTSTRRTHCRRLPTPPPRATANISTMPPASSRICSRTLVHADGDRDPRPLTLDLDPPVVWVLAVNPDPARD